MDSGVLGLMLIVGTMLGCISACSEAQHSDHATSAGRGNSRDTTTAAASAGLTKDDAGLEVVGPASRDFAFQDVAEPGDAGPAHPNPAHDVDERRGRFLSHDYAQGTVAIATVNNDRLDIVHHTYRGATFDMPVRVVDVQIDEVVLRGNDVRVEEPRGTIELNYTDDEEAPHLQVGEQYLLSLEWQVRTQRWRPSSLIGITAARKIVAGQVVSLNWTIDEVRSQIRTREVLP